MNTKTKAILAYAIIFAVGAATGFLLNHALEPDMPFRNRDVPPGWFEQRTERMQRGLRQGQARELRGGLRRHLIQELELTEEQIGPFFREMIRFRRDMGEELSGIRETERNIAREEYREFREEIAALLNEEQLKKMDEIIHPDSLRVRSSQFRRGVMNRMQPRDFF